MEGKEESGVLEAQDERHLAKLLRQKGYFLISTAEETKKEKRKFRLPKLDFLTRFFSVPLTEKLFFTKNLEVMIRTGVPLPRAFRILSTQAKNKKLKKALTKISEEIIKGQNLSAVLGQYPDIFSPLYQETVKVGEETGKLEESLRALSNQMEKEHNLKAKVKTAMVYPGIVLAMAFLIGIFMMIFAVPNLKNAFQELEIELPFTTKIILSTADFLTKKWPLALLMVAGLVFILFMLLRTQKGGRFKSKIALKIPFISKIVRQTNSALALRTLSSLLRSGVPVVRTLEVASGALGNFYFKQSLKEASKVVEKGAKVSQALLPYEALYSPMVLQMLQIGEETGETSEILEKLANFYEEEVTAATERLSSVIEPFLILVIGAIVGFFAISMMQPMFGAMKGLE